MPTTLLKNPVSVNATSTSESLSVAGTAAPPTTGAGAQPSNTLTVQGTTGQETTGTGQTAGTGANVSITAGTGGAAPTGSTNGAGGSVTINPGSPGVGAGTAATHGNVLLATAGGNVGIRTTTPSAPLDVGPDAVNGNIILRADATHYNTWQALSTGEFIMTGTPSANLAFTIESARTVSMFFLNNTSTRGPLMEMRKSGSAVGWLGVDGNYLGGTSTNFGLFAKTNLIFYTNFSGTEAMRLDTSGRLGIGTPAPGSKLHVNGGVQVGTPTGGDKGAGSINVSDDIYRNGTPMLERLEEAYRTIIELTKRIDRLEAKPPMKSKKGKPKRTLKSKKGKRS
jgi:hypothetical protein